LSCYDIIIMLMIMKSEDLKRRKRDAEISTNELRLEFDRVLKALKQGRSLTLTYRNKPLARIVPIEEERVLREDDPIYHMYEMAEAIGNPLTNMDIDRLVYGG
jgi:prevent-host-death family protein